MTNPEFRPSQEEINPPKPMDSFEEFKHSLELRAAKYAEGMQNHRHLLIDQEKMLARINELEEKLKSVENHDELTGLLNRNGFSKLVKKYQEEGVDGTVLMLDLDNFKQVNTYCGQLVGDAALKAVAIELMQLFRIETDKIAHDRTEDPAKPENFDQGVGRAGGEEFLVFLPGATPQQIHAKFKQFDEERQQELSKIEIEFNFNNRYLPKNLITFSGGITELKHNGSLEDAIVRANVAMRVAKDSEKNHLEISAEDLPSNAIEKDQA